MEGGVNGGEGVVEGRVSGGDGNSGGEGVVMLGTCRCLHMVVLGTHHRSHVVVLGAHSRSHVVVLGPHLLASLASCCHPRASVHNLSFIGEQGVGREGRREEPKVGSEWRRAEGMVVRFLGCHSHVHAGASSPFTCAGSLSLFVHAGVGPSSIHHPSCSFCIRWSCVAMWLVVFGGRCLCVTFVLVCASCHVVLSSSHVVGGASGCGGPSSSLVVVMGCCVGVLSACCVCWLCCGSSLLLGCGCAVSLLSGCSCCAMLLLLLGHGCHVSLSCVSAR